MKTIRVTRRSKMINELLDQARDEEVIIQAADGTEFLVSPIDDFDHEIAQQRRNKKLMDFLESRARQTEWIPLEEVERQLGLNKKPTNKKTSKRKNHRKK